MSQLPPLSRLERVNPRDIWQGEATDFTPWLASDQNLALLGDTLRIELELEAQEKFVGPFRADILCRNLADDSFVLIENQLAKTDHRHLGQLMTYAAGLDAVTIVWLATRFTDEHRAAIDWLNDITDESVAFFGLEIEVWRIGDSAAAPKFNVVCEPNEWIKSKAGGVVGGEGSGSSTKPLKKELWQSFIEFLGEEGSSLHTHNARSRSYLNLPMGRSRFRMSARVNTHQDLLTANVSIHGPLAKQHFNALRSEAATIEAEIGQALDWLEMPDKEVSRITIRRNGFDLDRKEDWPEHFEWLRATLETMNRAFRPRIKRLPAEYPTDDSEENSDD